jgi:FkbM family methyltransferase
MLLELARREVEPGMAVWDVGANVGIFSVAAAHRSRGVVLAVEPDPFLGDLLRRTAGLPENADLRLVTLPAAISAQAGATYLRIASRGRAANAIREVAGSTQMGGVRSECLVPTLRLDDLLGAFGAPNVIKVDVEGAECLLLEGAGNLLRDARAVWLIEVAGRNRDRVTEIFRSHRYALYDAEAPRWRGAEVDACATNTLAVPAERAGDGRAKS